MLQSEFIAFTGDTLITSYEQANAVYTELPSMDKFTFCKIWKSLPQDFKTELAEAFSSLSTENAQLHRELRHLKSIHSC